MDLSGDRDNILFIHRSMAFERCLDALREKGGTAEAAANKAEEFLRAVMGRGGPAREKFSFTRNGEARIKNCRKVDLGGGYRLICLLKDGRLLLLYAGSHDECSRWLMRNRGMKYEIEERVPVVPVVRDRGSREGPGCREGCEEDRIAEAYEAELMNRIDDEVLRKVFSGLVDR